MDVVSGLKVQRTSDNSALVVQWDLLPSEETAPILPLYEVEYRLSGSEGGVIARAERNESVLVVDGLDNAASYEVCVCACVCVCVCVCVWCVVCVCVCVLCL